MSTVALLDQLRKLRDENRQGFLMVREAVTGLRSDTRAARAERDAKLDRLVELGEAQERALARLLELAQADAKRRSIAALRSATGKPA